MNQGLSPTPEFRKLPTSFSADDSGYGGNDLATPAQKLSRPSSGKFNIPIPLVTVNPAGSPPVQILPARNTRIAAIIRNPHATASIVLGAEATGANAPQSIGGWNQGLEVKAGEAATIETTGEIWAIGLGAATFRVSGIEILSDVEQ